MFWHNHLDDDSFGSQAYTCFVAKERSIVMVRSVQILSFSKNLLIFGGNFFAKNTSFTVPALFFIRQSMGFRGWSSLFLASYAEGGRTRETFFRLKGEKRRKEKKRLFWNWRTIRSTSYHLFRFLGRTGSVLTFWLYCFDVLRGHSDPVSLCCVDTTISPAFVRRLTL